MNIGPRLVLQGVLVGSFALIVLVSNIDVSASTAIQVVRNQVKKVSKTIQISEPQQEEVAPTKTPEVKKKKCKVSQKYPGDILQWCNLITRYAKQNNLDPDLIAALIWQESGGNPSAYSHSGAVGLMQVMPRDGLAASFKNANGEPYFANRPTIKELKKPEFNIQYGTGMLSGLVERHGDIRDALKAYGPRDVGYYYADKVLTIEENYGK